MDSLSLFKVLADASRYAIYQHLLEAGEPLPTLEISGTLKLHPNTVRLHLERLKEAGLVEAEPDRHGSVGRPQNRWKALAVAPELGMEPGGLRLLSHLLAELAAGGRGSPMEVGRRAGERRRRERAGRHLPGDGGRPAAACLRALVEELSRLGFDPSVDSENVLSGDAGEERVAVSFNRCPFRELAVVYPDLVCELHRGITEGIASAAAEESGTAARLESFSTLVDADPCRVEASAAAL